jgi:hypothetical protein
MSESTSSEGAASESGLPAKTFAAVLDEVIPARGSALPGAGGLGLGAFVADQLGEAVPVVAGALADLDARAQAAGAADFASLDAGARGEMLRAVASAHPGFLEALIFHLYAGYYHHPQVMEALGLEGRPPFPEGYPLELGDLDLLDPVRQRPRLYREA